MICSRVAVDRAQSYLWSSKVNIAIQPISTMKMVWIYPLTLLLVARSSFGSEALSFSITTEWNGDAFDHLPINITLSTNEDGKLQMDLEAPYFASTNPQSQLVPDECPQRPGAELYNYEVVEAFFLNDNNEYLEMEVAPNGEYLNLMLGGRRQDILVYLPLFESPPKVDNPCQKDSQLAEEDGYTCTWTASVVIPDEYLPKGVTKFNAFGVHGDMSGEDRVTHYESLYPISPEDGVEAPDFHYLEAFQAIDLSAIGYKQAPEESPLWTQAKLQNQPIVQRYELFNAFDCSQEVKDQAFVTTQRNEASLSLNVSISGQSDAQPDISDYFGQAGSQNALFDEPSESVWAQFTNEDGLALRIGMNPFGAYQANLMVYEEILETLTLDSGPVCQIDEEISSQWTCQVELPAEYFPQGVKYFQLVHHHQPLVDSDGQPIPEDHIITAVCPGNPFTTTEHGLTAVDWQGCLTDNRYFVNPEENEEASPVWLDLVHELTSTIETSDESTTVAY